MLLAATAGRAGDAPPTLDLDKICAAQGCRAGGYDAVVFVDAQHYKRIPVTHSPYLPGDGGVLIFPGETVAVTFAFDGDKLGPPISVKRYAAEYPLLTVKGDASPSANSDDAALPAIKGELPADQAAQLPPNTLLISYGQMKPTGETGMVLKLEHNLSATLKVDAIIAEIGSNEYRQHYTSSCPIMPKMFDDESWPNALGPILLRNFRLIPAGANQFTCQ